MKKILIDLQKLSFLLITVLFFSCENPSEIGFDFDGNADATSIYSDTLSLNISTILADSTVNGKSNFILTGVLNDPVFGIVTAESYFQPSLVMYATASGSTATDTLTVNANPIADSLQLRIVTNGLIYGDTLSRSFFNIYRLKKPMNFSKNYNGTENVEYEGASLARFGLTSKSFKNTTFDSLKAVFIDLPKSIAQEILNAAPVTGADNSKFSAAIKGFAIVPESSNKAIYSFTTGPLGGNTSTLIANWHYLGDTTNHLYQFDLNGPRHSYLSFNRASGVLSQLSKTKNELSSKLTNNLSFVQGGSGISTKINFDNLKNLGANIRVSKAILEFSLKAESINPVHPRIFNFVLAELGLNNQQSRNTSNLLTYLTPIGNDLSGVVYTLVDSTNTVNLDVTNYLQKITNKTIASNGLMIMPSVTTTSGNGILANDHLKRVVFAKPKLKIYYTKF
jgi:hypothetical protein